jgi:2-polyprenyl-3-methyl-5-hydroxy-6-metoxy-1,4-benzoquinol methylase
LGHDEIIKREFKKQAKNFSDRLLTLNNQDYLSWIVDSLHLDEQMKVLDVAAGTGILSRAISPKVSHVTAIDLSEDMIKELFL